MWMSSVQQRTRSEVDAVVAVARQMREFEGRKTDQKEWMPQMARGATLDAEGRRFEVTTVVFW